MADAEQFMRAFFAVLRYSGMSGEKARIRRSARTGDVLAYGSSSLEIVARDWPEGASADATDGERWPLPFGTLWSPIEGREGEVRHRGLRRGHVHADLYEEHYFDNFNDGGERTLGLYATVEWEGAWYGLRMFSNSCDFAKALGEELPESLTWDKLLAAFQEFAGTPMLHGWDVDEKLG